MNESDVRQLFLRKPGVRIEPEMAGYVLKRIQPDDSATATVPTQPFPVMGADARTGMPIRLMIDPEIGDSSTLK